jgi:hypothetical protein
MRNFHNLLWLPFQQDNQTITLFGDFSFLTSVAGVVGGHGVGGLASRLEERKATDFVEFLKRKGPAQSRRGESVQEDARRRQSNGNGRGMIGFGIPSHCIDVSDCCH